MFDRFNHYTITSEDGVEAYADDVGGAVAAAKCFVTIDGCETATITDAQGRWVGRGELGQRPGENGRYVLRSSTVSPIYFTKMGNV